MLRLLLGILRAANGVNVFEYEIEWFNMLISISSKGVAAHKLAWQEGRVVSNLWCYEVWERKEAQES